MWLLLVTALSAASAATCLPAGAPQHLNIVSMDLNATARQLLAAGLVRSFSVWLFDASNTNATLFGRPTALTYLSASSDPPGWELSSPQGGGGVFELFLRASGGQLGLQHAGLTSNDSESTVRCLQQQGWMPVQRQTHWLPDVGSVYMSMPRERFAVGVELLLEVKFLPPGFVPPPPSYVIS